jgi:hypothetical protein
MNYSKYFSFKPDLSSGWMISIYYFLGIFWCIQIAIALTGQLNSNVVFQWFLFAGILVGGKGAGLSRSLIRGIVVLRQLRTPQPLGKAYLLAVLSHATLIWLVFAAGGTVLLLACHFAWASISAVAFFSVLFSISTLTSLPDSHVIMRAWKGFLYVLVVLLAPLMIWKGFVNPIDYLPQLPMWLLIVMTLSWPLTIYVIAGKWKSRPSPAAEKFRLTQKGVLDHLCSYFERFSQLASSTQMFYVKPTLAGKLTSLVSLQYLSLTLLSNIANARWNNGIGPYHFFGIFMIASLCCSLLVFKDLHWRVLLAPGRLRRNLFGWHIFSVSVVVQLLVYIVFAGIWALVAWAWFDISHAQTLETAWNYRAAPLQLLAANSLAVLLMATFNSRWAGVILIGIACALAGLTLAAYGFTLQAPIWFYVGPNYLIGLLVTTIVFVLLSNRLWTRQRLLRHMRVY